MNQWINDNESIPMTLNPGNHLGPYEIVAPLGAGGMGEVYRARDTRLGRDVALKVLPVDLAGDTARRARFEQEARLLAALNHPNILGIHDIGDSYVVMELVEGSTLRGAQLPLRKVLDIGAQIAEGLAAAHGAGITHRDLKPDNVMVTKDGRVKILDFGLAKVNSPKGGEKETRTAYSDPGAVMGTVGYMSPEQVRAQGVDARSDIFSLGVLLHELIRGERPFLGDSAAETMTAIVKTDAPPLPEGTPSGVVRVIEGCLAKQPEERWQSARDLSRQLRWLADFSTTTSTTQAAIQTSRRPIRERFVWLAALLAVSALFAWALLRTPTLDRDQPAYRFFIKAPKVRGLTGLSLSADGRRLAFVGNDRRLWVQDLDQPEGKPIGSGIGSAWPFWSPDNRWIGFFAGGKLRKMPAEGGASQELADALGVGRSAWSAADGGVILFARSGAEPLFRVSPSGGKSSPATTLDRKRGDIYHASPRFLPDGRRFLFFVDNKNESSRGIYLGSLDSEGPGEFVLASRRMPILATAPGGQALLLTGPARAQSLQGWAFDPARATLLSPDPAIVFDRSVTMSITRSIDADASATGLLVFNETVEGRFQLLHASPAAPSAPLGEPGQIWNMDLSPDGRKVAISRGMGDKGNEIDILDAHSGESLGIRIPIADGYLTVWSPDGTSLLCGGGPRKLYRAKLASPASPELLIESDVLVTAGDWSRPDGKSIVYSEVNRETGSDLWLLDVNAKDRKPQPLLVTKSNEFDPQFSPDGRWLAYTSDESGSVEVYVTNFPPTPGRKQVSVRGGSRSRWSRDGRELFYYNTGQSKIMSVTVQAGASFECSAPKSVISALLPNFPAGGIVPPLMAKASS